MSKGRFSKTRQPRLLPRRGGCCHKRRGCSSCFAQGLQHPLHLRRRPHLRRTGFGRTKRYRVLTIEHRSSHPCPRRDHSNKDNPCPHNRNTSGGSPCSQNLDSRQARDCRFEAPCRPGLGRIMIADKDLDSHLPPDHRARAIRVGVTTSIWTRELRLLYNRQSSALANCAKEMTLRTRCLVDLL